MRVYRKNSGYFEERHFYTNNDIEILCTDELNKVNLLSSVPRAIQVDRFIEKRFNISPSYEELPEGVLGLIEFNENGVKEILISRSLDEEGSKSSARRVNTTLAHEAGHGLLHTHIFVLKEKPVSLLRAENIAGSKILCRGDSIKGLSGYRERKSEGWWLEHQANMVIGPMLLPKSLVIMALEPFLIKSGVMEKAILDHTRRVEAEKSLSEVFDVNPVVVKIRLDVLFPQGDSRQQYL
jgi:hypothetical protein